MFKQVSLPPERHAQLERYADQLNLSVAETIATMIRHEIEAGRMPADIPGITVASVPQNRVLFAIQGAFARELESDAARGVADALDRLGSPGRASQVLDLDANLHLERRGRGVVIRDIYADTSHSLALGVARDVASMIRKAAA